MERTVKALVIHDVPFFLVARKIMDLYAKPRY